MVGGANDVGRGAVVFDQIVRPGIVVLFKPPDKLDIGSAEGIDILVIVAYGKNR